MKRLGLLIVSGFAFACAQSASAEPTDIVVHVLAKGAKFVGTSMGGAQVTLTDADTGEVLAQGLTAGGTGSTPNLMTTPHVPGDVLSTDDAAKFEATLDLDQPRKITATVTGPMEPAGAAMTASSTQWVLPGRNISQGDGWLIELRGFAVSLQGDVPSEISLASGPQTVPLTAKVTMMCGCPLTPGGNWDSDMIDVGAIVVGDNQTSAPLAFSYAGEPSTFHGEILISEPGNYTVEVYAYDASNGNTGLQRFMLVAD